ncbi:MAG: T4 RnlA family RNA ligase [Patescibacteria group bacterium]|nr:MAG: T4 RnlA family RNA ligase [Patescibacteria group bacterium]
MTGLEQLIRVLQNEPLFQEAYGHLVIVKRRGPFVLLNYNQDCQKRAAWDDVTSVCRGLIVDTRDWSVAARGFDKFSNVGNHPTSTKFEDLPDLPFTAFEKVDGTFGMMYRDEHGEAWIATRGSFDTPQALRGTEMLRKLRLEALPEGYTPIFEIVYPKQHETAGDVALSVITYDYEGLVLLGLRHRVTGEELPWNTVVEVAKAIGARLPKTYAFSSFEEAYAAAKALPADQEGFVLLFANGLRVKVKGHAYCARSRSTWGISAPNILDTLVAGGKPAYLKLVADANEEARIEADRIVAEIDAKARALCVEAESALFCGPFTEDRKTFASWLRYNVRKELHGAVFMLFDHKEPNWYKLVRDFDRAARPSSR